jgi:dipeptidyl-peptidase-4
MMSRVRLAPPAILGLLLLSVGAAPAQQELTVQRVFGSAELRPASVAAQWLPDSEQLQVVRRDPATGATDLIAENPRTGEYTVILDGSLLVPTGQDEPIGIEDYAWSPDGSRLLIYTNSQRVWRANTKGIYYVFDVDARTLTPLSSEPGWQQFAKWSPTGGQIGFVRDNDIFVADIPSYTERALTTDGSENVINGTFDWVYEEELGLQDGWRWSPDGSEIAFWQLDQSAIRTFYMIDDSELYPELFPFRYPKAGEENSEVRVGVIDVSSGDRRWMDLGEETDIYVARMDWAGSSDELVVQRLNRLQNQLDVVLVDASTGNARTIFTETDPAWVDVDDDLTWLDDGDHFLWTSDRDGYEHIYLYDRSGTPVRQLTSGDFDVTAMNGVNEEDGWVYFTAARPTPMQRHIFRVRLDGGATQQITDAPGWHSALLSPGGDFYVGRHSEADVPMATGIYESNGDLVRILEDNAGLKQTLAGENISETEFFQFTTSDGVTLNGSMILPPDFDPAREYPVMMYVYGGPGSQTVTDGWGGTRYLWHQLLAQKGYVVASIDNRGTGARGRDFRKVTYLALGEWEVHDQIEGARYLAELPYVDESRIGMWGWSYGGYMTALSLMMGGDLFKAGVSVAPVTAWNLYDTIYTERFMRTPLQNPEGYSEGAPLTHAARLESEFLLIHGTGDDNVHFQNAVQLAAALQEAGKQFDFMLYPNQTHSIADRQVHLYTLMTDWVLENL